jgi:hypothetical protein
MWQDENRWCFGACSQNGTGYAPKSKEQPDRAQLLKGEVERQKTQLSHQGAAFAALWDRVNRI